MMLREQTIKGVEELLEALKPFAMAYERLEHYNDDCRLTFDDRVQVTRADYITYELFADESEPHGKEPKQLLSVGHLANAAQLYNAYAAAPKSWDEAWDRFDAQNKTS
jgi:hypothetical protein